MKCKLWKGRTKWLLIVPAIILVSFGFITLKDKEFDIIKNTEIFYSVFNELDRFYVDETKPEELFQSAIEGMLSSLDPYTVYIPEEEVEDFNFMTTGEYGGIGAYIRKAGDFAIITEPYEGFPAQLAGLMAGDTIIAIDEISTKGMVINKVSDLLKGTPNTLVKLQIKRTGLDGFLEKTIVRKRITIPNVPYSGMLDEQTGYIKLTNFTSNAGTECKEALTELKKKGAQSIILDLRGNPGGLLIESVNVSNLFINKEQEIVSTKGKIRQWDGVYKTTEAPVDTDIPIVILVNRGSASASEIVAGAMQDLDRAVIIGQRTFGKGLVQTTRPLSYNAQLKVTTAKYYIPSGRCIQAVDYSHRNEDGSVGYIPDSLIMKFETNNGRIVYDGGGITPDIVLEPETVSSIALSLYTKYLIFDYATLYVATHETLPSPEVFTLNDQEYERFLQFLQGKDYDYTTNSDDKLNELISVAKQEKYYDVAVSEFEALRDKLAHDKEKDLQTFKKEIRNLLEEEISGRYYYQKGSIQASIQDDNEINKAMEILQNPEAYATILQGKEENINTVVLR